MLGVVALGIAAIAVFGFALGGDDGGSPTAGQPPTASTTTGTTTPAHPPRRPATAPTLVALTPMACEHTGSGKAYEVGPGKALDSLGDVPWETLAAGDTVRIHWRAEPYREKFFLRGKGTEDQPIVVCGVAGPNGELPIIDGQNAVTRPGLPTPYSGKGEPRGLIHVTVGAADPWGYKPAVHRDPGPAHPQRLLRELVHRRRTARS